MSLWDDRIERRDELGRLRAENAKLWAALNEIDKLQIVEVMEIFQRCAASADIPVENHFGLTHKMVAELLAALFTIQCQQLDRATDKTLSAQKHRELAMATRDWIIATLNEKTR